MRTHKAIHLTLSLLLVAGLGVCAFAAETQSAPKKKSASSHARSFAHRAKSSKKSRRRERGQKAPTPDRITEIQQALGKDGSYARTPNGKWDASTVEATKRFQESHGLAPTGKLDARTLQQLGLGSSIAGVAPPMPPVSSTTATVAPTQSVRQQQ